MHAACDPEKKRLSGKIWTKRCPPIIENKNKNQFVIHFFKPVILDTSLGAILRIIIGESYKNFSINLIIHSKYQTITSLHYNSTICVTNAHT